MRSVRQVSALSSENGSAKSGLDTAAGVASCDKGRGHPGAMGPLTQPHPWLRGPEHLHLPCFSKEAAEEQITGQEPGPLGRPRS